MGQKAWRQRHRCLPLRTSSPADCKPVENAAFQINERFAGSAKRASGSNRASPSPSVNTDQDESCDVAQWPLVRFNLVTLEWSDMDGLRFPISPARPKQFRSFRTVE